LEEKTAGSFQSRVSECQQRVNDLIDLRLCSDGVKSSIDDEDYEQGPILRNKIWSNLSL
jgi:hypothetical protein